MNSRRTIFCWRLLQRSVYGLALVALVLILLIQTYQCVILYLSEPTYFSTEVLAQRKVAFPAMTVCPEGGGYKEDVLQVLCTTHSHIISSR